MRAAPQPFANRKRGMPLSVLLRGYLRSCRRIELALGGTSLFMSRLLAWLVLGGFACAQAPSSSMPTSSLPPAVSESALPATSLPAPTLPATASLAPPTNAVPTPTPAITPNVPIDTKNLLPDIPTVPKGSVSLIGGTIRSLDRVRDRLSIQVFGGGKAVVLFDPRTRVFRNGQKIPTRELQPGERVYVDTVLDGTEIFAKNIRVGGDTSVAQTSGQIVEHEPGSLELTYRDALSPAPVRLRLDANSVITRDNRTVAASELLPGALVSVDFKPDGKGQAVVRQISILATPGSTFYFSGRLVHLDLSKGTLVVLDPRDEKSYEVEFDTRTLRSNPDLHEGVEVSVTANFDGNRYLARAIAVSSPGPK